MAEMTTMKISRENLERLRLRAGHLPLGEYVGMILEGIEVPKAKELPGLEYSIADIRVLISSRLDQLEASILEKLEAINNALNVPIAQSNMNTGLLNRLVPGYHDIVMNNLAGVAEQVKAIRENIESGQGTQYHKVEFDNPGFVSLPAFGSSKKKNLFKRGKR